MIVLRGIAWSHARGFDPLQATASAYMAGNPDVRIEWEKRSLQEFGDYPIERLAERFDLLVIDHPFVGFAAVDGCLLPLDQHIDPALLSDLAHNSVGKSYRSYSFGGHQWALATDAAGQVSAYRPDLLERLDEGVPDTWDALLRLARRLHGEGGARGLVAIPLIPIDSIMSFFSICANAGEEPCSTPEVLVSRSAGLYALDMLRELSELSHPESLAWNPPKTLERMSTSDEVVYCPLLFGYSNYARPGFREKLVRFTNIPSAGYGPQGGILGGAGLAISSRTQHPQAASAYASYVAGADVQRSLYFEAGGQPGHRAAWLDAELNAACSNYFFDTLETLDRSYLRPRYNGYMELQERAGLLIHNFLSQGGAAQEVLDELDELYRHSLAHAPARG